MRSRLRAPHRPRAGPRRRGERGQRIWRVPERDGAGPGRTAGAMSAVVTGVGVAAPTGLGADDHWQATLRGGSGIGPIKRFDASGYPARLAGEVPGFEPADHLPSRLLPQTDQVTRLALAAGAFALSDAGVDPSRLPEYDMGVVTASASGGFEYGHRELQNLWSLGP